MTYKAALMQRIKLRDEFFEFFCPFYASLGFTGKICRNCEFNDIEMVKCFAAAWDSEVTEEVIEIDYDVWKEEFHEFNDLS